MQDIGKNQRKSALHRFRVYFDPRELTFLGLLIMISFSKLLNIGRSFGVKVYPKPLTLNPKTLKPCTIYTLNPMPYTRFRVGRLSKVKVGFRGPWRAKLLRIGGSMPGV